MSIPFSLSFLRLVLFNVNDFRLKNSTNVVKYLLSYGSGLSFFLEIEYIRIVLFFNSVQKPRSIAVISIKATPKTTQQYAD